MKKLFSSVLVTSMLLSVGVNSAFAMGGASGANVNYHKQGQIGETVVNPYGIAPLTAIIKNGGYVLKDVSVEIVPKENGQKIAYTVSKRNLLTHGGIPIFGLYPDYLNTVKVSYTRVHNKKEEKINETYKIFTAPLYNEVAGIDMQKSTFFTKAEVKKLDPKFKDRLYFVNNIVEKSGIGTKVVWNNPIGGALEWNYYPRNFIIDTTGEVRWYMLPSKIYDLETIYQAGVMMGFKQNDNDGRLSFGYGQRYAKYDILGHKSFNRRLPSNYNDFSHSMDDADNGHFFIRAASSNLKRADGKYVRTVRDVIVEVDENGNVVDEWRLFDILDPYRDSVLKSLDQGAVCLNIDASKAGQTISEEELAKLDDNDHFGDILGSGPGRNWAHVNSVDYDPVDDSIIISSRHQSAIIKIGRDKKVKWILGASEGWSDKFKNSLLTPVDNKGKKIDCNEKGVCENSNFDFTWTQHTAFKIDEKSKGDIIYVSAFDNGDGRGMEQPAIPSMKYSRMVVYKIDQKKKTVEQVWEWGKERENSLYSPVASLTEYQRDKDSIMGYFATAGTVFDFKTGAFLSEPNPTIVEFEWGAKEPSVEIQLFDTTGYQAWPFSVEKALSK
ncbi:aryl-sulfate sulfotransferase [Campylobacter sp. FMV-PI01]|uniref:Aryl-sulfate sulfotransferase n=1 Tax=Campylobacter portucalensis TaxID=2608384 RepID=A0A6L5WFR7_9BACT|nr:aryl-sulfate sulfotransferase [Campylobacter portucalensis]MSN95938.1 aryl-sulfate sulfotransferase [Campylobacter portucalensis]